mmetsp:Transcript_1332/g.4207  ORF Transcript_1332/g.4207 Transcript_1332/m.4207 type:complete len:448 (-) Transcript_1332:219-1562(-)
MATSAYGHGPAVSPDEPWPHFKAPRDALRELWPSVPGQRATPQALAALFPHDYAALVTEGIRRADERAAVAAGAGGGAGPATPNASITGSDRSSLVIAPPGSAPAAPAASVSPVRADVEPVDVGPAVGDDPPVLVQDGATGNTSTPIHGESGERGLDAPDDHAHAESPVVEEAHATEHGRGSQDVRSPSSMRSLSQGELPSSPLRAAGTVSAESADGTTVEAARSSAVGDATTSPVPATTAGVQVQAVGRSAVDEQGLDTREVRRQQERLEELKGGMVLLKYQQREPGGLRGVFSSRGSRANAGERRREERLVKLTPDGLELRWTKPGPGSGGGHNVRVAEITAVVHGHDADLFQAMAVVPDAADVCFAVVTGKRTYCFAARTPGQAEAWVVGLSALRGLPLARRGHFLWSQLHLRSRDAARGHGLGALLPRIARELEEEDAARAAS